jgi:hypothetical protein
MWTTKIAFVSGMLVAVTGLPGLAQPNLETACMTVPCVYDSHGQKVGMVSSSGAPDQQPQLRSLLRPIGRNWYVLGYTDQGLDADAVFYYQDADCASAPYFAVGIGWVNAKDQTVEQLVPYPGVFDGARIWGPTGPVEEIFIKSFQYPTRTSYCWVENPPPSVSVVARAAAIIDTTIFYPLLKMQ